ncbi:dolichol kinase [Blastocladiella emersonii ATCC 22665]|nr:dolichol kinase [Blastocladiella emersonii ATCC 22665]
MATQRPSAAAARATPPSTSSASTESDPPSHAIPPPKPWWRLVGPVLIENALVTTALAVRCHTDRTLTPFSAVFSTSATCAPATFPWWAWASIAAATLADCWLERRRLLRLDLAVAANASRVPYGAASARPASARSSGGLDSESDAEPLLVPPPNPAASPYPSRVWPLEAVTRSQASPGLLYGLCLLPALLSRSSYASFVSHAIAWEALGLAATLVAFATRWLAPRTLARVFQAAMVLHLLTPSNPWTVVALAVTAAPTLLHAFPRAFSLGEALTVSTGVVLVADSLRARPTHAHVVVAAMQHLAIGTACACACAAPRVAQLRHLAKGKGKPGQAERDRNVASMWLHGILAAVVFFGVTPLMYLRSGHEPWTWVIGYILTSRGNSLIVAYWLAVLAVGYWVFPSHRSANTQRKSYHLMAIAIILPGYFWTPVFTSLALVVALSSFVFAEILRLARAPPLGALLDDSLSPFRDDRDESPLLTSHIYLLLGIALPVWVGVIEGTWRAGLAGMAALGVGDAVASLVGRRVGWWRWHSRTSKSVQGSVAFVAGALAFFVALGEPLTLPLVVAVAATALVEAVSSQFDNFVVPLVMLLTIM